jgi:hypothetical protein
LQPADAEIVPEGNDSRIVVPETSAFGLPFSVTRTDTNSRSSRPVAAGLDAGKLGDGAALGLDPGLDSGPPTIEHADSEKPRTARVT